MAGPRRYGVDTDIIPAKGGMGPGGIGEGNIRARGLSVPSQAAIKAAKKGTDALKEEAAIERKLATMREINAEKQNPARAAAEKNATTSEENGVKVTKYPYVGEPKFQSGNESDVWRRSMGEEYKKGGKVKSASARADGCAIRGKTRA